MAENKKTTNKDKTIDPQKDFKKEIEQLNQRIEELINQLKIERADSINLRRRFEKEKNDLSGYYKIEIVKNFLPILDNFERAFQHRPKELANHPYIKGIDGIIKQFETVLNQIGVKKIDCLNKPFDPNFHEAVAFDEDSKGQNEIVVEELQTGYLIGDVVLRPSLVKVKRVD